ncbi:hypothetical protein GR7B_00224 [Vibrio phage vB_VcorM_GR7B]|nr:hypothetical protein GR7B_00224 [Vibrio phage vB_VcorM_GR7B]
MFQLKLLWKAITTFQTLKKARSLFHAAPTLYDPQFLDEYDCQHKVIRGGKELWVPARPYGLQGAYLKTRLTLAWGVLTGRYDALDWKDGDSHG